MWNLERADLKKDFDDLNTLLKWLECQTHDPFDENRTLLQTLDTGLIANDTVNCDTAESIGSKNQESLDNVSLSAASIKRSEKAITLASLKPSVKIKNDDVIIDPLVLFSRLIVLIQRTTDICGYFAYELAPVPTALFKDNMMRKPNKSSLAKALDKKMKMYLENNENESDDASVATVSECEAVEVMSEDTENEDELQDGGNSTNADEIFVIDGGYVLRRIIWDKFSTYGEIVQKYISYLRSRYGICYVVFDGYLHGPSTKDHEHRRRMSKAVVSPDVCVNLDSEFSSTSQKSSTAQDCKKSPLAPQSPQSPQTRDCYTWGLRGLRG